MYLRPTKPALLCRRRRASAEAFNRLLFCCPSLELAAEVHARLGIAYKALEKYTLALKHLQLAFEDAREAKFLSKIQLRFHIAHCYDVAGDLTRATEEYRLLEADKRIEPHSLLRANVYRQLGWISYRLAYRTSEQRLANVNEAEQYLARAKEIAQNCGRTYYYLGRCYGELPSRAHDAFSHYRSSIDKSEADADTWCSIGILYQQQQQPMDALQAYICAVELDPEHSEAWINLGRLYEINHLYREALHCYKKSIEFDPVSPEPIKERIKVLEKELHSAGNVLNSAQARASKLPPLNEAWKLPIPQELRGRQEEFLRLKHESYIAGSPVWQSPELSAIATSKSVSPRMSAAQRQLSQILRLNPSQVEASQKALLRQVDSKLRVPGAQLPFVSSDDVADFLGEPSGDCDLGGFGRPLLEIKKENFEMPSTSGLIKKEEPEDEVERLMAEEKKPTGDDLPPTFSLLAPLRVPISVSSAEVLEMAAKRVDDPPNYKSCFEETVPPPISLPRPDEKVALSKDKLLVPTPCVVVESPKEATSPELQRYCYEKPIALIRGLTMALRIDLSLFSTKSLLETAPNHEVEVRQQYRMPGDMNVDHLGNPTWACHSVRSFTTVAKYAVYQAETFKHSLRSEVEKLKTPSGSSKYTTTDGPAAKRRRRNGAPEEPPLCSQMPEKPIRFGTNVDLSDENLFRAQLRELEKMPGFCRLTSPCNMLTHLGHTVLGMNTVQLYMKVPGSRTPGHQENNCFASINVNIGPGDCEWFGVAYEYWPQIDEMCKRRNLDFLKGAWWPNYEDLINEGIPVYKFTQKPGDLVWVGGGCVHWVQATGWCNNIAWNVGPMTAKQLDMALFSHEWNKLRSYKSLVPMQHLSWEMAKNMRFTQQKPFNIVKGVLIRSLHFSKVVADYVKKLGKPLKMHPREKNEVAHYCFHCTVEVFNIIFARAKPNSTEYTVSCVFCARKNGINDYVALQQYTFEQLASIFDTCQLQPTKTPMIC
uniref:JmjC domain-containing protein n=1 Tax=Steinernema glaseri TaxID=37863 RepID=A0A1I7Y2W8_9BILA